MFTFHRVLGLGLVEASSSKRCDDLTRFNECYNLKYILVALYSLLLVFYMIDFRYNDGFSSPFDLPLCLPWKQTIAAELLTCFKSIHF